MAKCGLDEAEVAQRPDNTRGERECPPNGVAVHPTPKADGVQRLVG